MTYLSVGTPVRKIWPAIIAALALFIAAATTISGVNVSGFRFGFGFVPLLVIAIWPRQANTLISLVLVFLAGIFADWATGGIFGQWALVFILTWAFLRPELRSSPFAPVGILVMWLVTCGLALVVVTLSGFFVTEVWPDLAVLGRQIILATLLLPVAMFLRRGIAIRFDDAEDWR